MNNKWKFRFWFLGFAVLAFLGSFSAVVAVEQAKNGQKIAWNDNPLPSIVDLPPADQVAPDILPTPPAETPAPAPEPAPVTPKPIAAPATVAPQPAKVAAPAPAVKKPKSSRKTKSS
ncbi:MAG: hypothetical protein A2808_03925 [Candidatus Moranbacteria bacterium RIFCSPHIGHO2_01_FULL_55_24]|nr:MAG: hypothetical protein A2808_03925 [Candidatus Moranbacteria bacterium RIFCSPHIGHO2_01_FULL_55_24]